ncbi:hypothetical protein LIER_28925 [Lithospermum erythrorhizon]|uniref:Protein FAR1-RELATED SEQUENCE n=1 Tax=Lithospermum erythrorhizon TaxID=34254 RepID=A0AAV3RJ80_LITER
MMKDLMSKAARAANVPYFEYRMQKIKNVLVEAYEELPKIDRKKWTRCAFRSRTNYPQLVNNWAEAFNIFIMNARDQPIITILNTIYHTIMIRIEEECERKLRWKGLVCPKVDEDLMKCEAKTFDYIVRPLGSSRYKVTSTKHGFVVDIDKKHCSCGMWQ